MIIRQHVQHVKDAKKSNLIPQFRKASFLKFATLPRDRKWHIAKLTTLPRAPYQPHAKNKDDVTFSVFEKRAFLKNVRATEDMLLRVIAAETTQKHTKYTFHDEGFHSRPTLGRHRPMFLFFSIFGLFSFLFLLFCCHYLLGFVLVCDILYLLL